MAGTGAALAGSTPSAMATTPQHAQRPPTGARPKRRTVIHHRSRPPPRTRHSSHPAAPGNPDPLPLGLEPHDGHQRIRSSNSSGSTAEHVPRRTVGGKSGRSRRPVAATHATSHNSTAERGHPQARPDPDPPCSTSQGQQLRGRGRDKSRRAQRGGQPQQFQHHNRLQLQHFSHFGFTATQCRHTSPRSSNYKSDGATEQPPAQSSTTQQQRSCNAESAAYLGPNQPP